MPKTHPPIELHLRIRVPEGGREALVEFLREAIAYYEAPGGIRVRLLEDREDPTRFVEIIEYDSEEAYTLDDARVREDGLAKEYLARWRALLAEPPSVEVYRNATPVSGSPDKP